MCGQVEPKQLASGEPPLAERRPVERAHLHLPTAPARPAEPVAPIAPVATPAAVRAPPVRQDETEGVAAGGARCASHPGLLGIVPQQRQREFREVRGVGTRTTLGLTPASGKPVGSELFRLQFREVTPDDYDLLLLLDDALPKSTVPKTVLSRLPSLLAKDCGATECSVCLSEFQPRERVVQLPCMHAFHPECATRWLTKCRDTCPLCSAPV